MRHFLLLLLVGTVAVGYIFRDHLESTLSQLRPNGSFSAISGMRSLGESLGGQFERFGSGVDSLNH